MMSRLDEADKNPVDFHEGIDNTLFILQNRLKATPSRSGTQTLKEYGNLPEVECYVGNLDDLNLVLFKVFQLPADAYKILGRDSMGYTTKFDGIFTLNERLFDSEVLYLLEFSRTRRCKRNVAILQNIPDSARESVGLPLGEDGGYFVNQKWDEEHDEISVVDYNKPPRGQPGLWCQWIPTPDGRGIHWDGGEKFYHYIAWLQYLIIHFLEPWGYCVEGEVKWTGEDPSDTGVIKVKNNKIVSPAGTDFLKEATSPIPVPRTVLQGLEAALATDTTLVYSWIALMTKAIELGYPETATWIESHLEKYAAGVERGFIEEDTQ
jgi:hypothetical protein